MHRLCEPPGDSPTCSPGCWGDGEEDYKCERSNVPCYTDLKDMLSLHERHHPFDVNNECKQGNGCMYNEIILAADAWVRSLPGLVQAIFFTAKGSPSDERRARRIHEDFIHAYSLHDGNAPPLIRFSISNPSSPFQEITGPMSRDNCNSIMGESDGKFWKMWGREAWLHRQLGERGCWISHNSGPEAFFTETFNGAYCDVNWYEGADGELGRESARPHFNEAAAALLGFDDTIFAFCSEVLGMSTSYAGAASHFNSELAQRCVKANQNILRLISPRVPWNMCQNLQWLLCAAHGELPGQQSNVMRFASAPKVVAVESSRSPYAVPTTCPFQQLWQLRALRRLIWTLGTTRLHGHALTANVLKESTLWATCSSPKFAYLIRYAQTAMSSLILTRGSHSTAT